MDTALIVFSHLRWSFVFQRPQQILTRLAKRYPVIFIEEPVKGTATRWEVEEVDGGRIQICRAHLSDEVTWNNSELPRLIQDHLRDYAIQRFIYWAYTPMAVPLLQALEPAPSVYDCMDELSMFLNSPKQLCELEESLLGQCDMVFTGGPSLYQLKKERHPAVHCFPSSVDAAHFGLAREKLPEPADQEAIPHPRFGYFGVIDERIDLGLIDHLARNHPDWHLVIVGPVVKIDPATLPRHANIHYPGQKAYRELPEYLAGWDVCLLPFARNDATKFISPTKILEYMAAEKPIVSTRITDVVQPYSDVVYLGDTPQEFARSCEEALHASPPDRASRTTRMQEIIAQTSWDRTVAQMADLLKKLPPRKSTVRRRRGPNASNPPIVVIGAGPTGLSAAYHLGENSILIERADRVGGLCRSIQDGGFTFDQAGHIMFSKDPYVHRLYELLLGDNVHWQDREAWIYSKGVHTRYPFQGALFGLPADVITECIVGAIESRYGSSQAAEDDGTLEGIRDCCADGVLESTVRCGKNGHNGSNGHGEVKKTENFEEFIYRVWGRGIAKHFAIPYNKKLWTVPLKEMETSWLGGRVPMPDLEEIIDGALKPVSKPMGPNARFGYPLHGGFQALMNGFLPHLRGKLRLKTSLMGVTPSEHLLTLSDGTELRYDKFISTIPLRALIRLMGGEVPRDIQQAAAELRHVSVRCVNLGVGREKLTEKHWIYYPEDTVFHRIFVQGNASPHCNAPGGFGLTCEITYSATKPLPCDAEKLIDLCIRDCQRVGILQPGDPIWTANQVDIPCAYVIYDHTRARNVAVIREWLEKKDIFLAGRYSEWEYYNSDHAFLAGKRAAETVQALQPISR